LIPIQNKIWCVPKDANVWYQRLWLSFRIHGRVYQIRRQKICGGDSKGKACQEVWSKRNEIPESLDHDSFKKKLFVCCSIMSKTSRMDHGRVLVYRYSILVYLQHKFVRLLRSL